MSDETNDKSKPDKSQSEKADKQESEPEKEPVLGPLVTILKEAGQSAAYSDPEANGTEVVIVEGADLVSVSTFLRDDDRLAFDLLVSVSGVDWKDHRDSVVHLYSTVHHHSLVIKTRADGEDRVPSLMSVWPAADWHERESYDLMGITYEGHPDLRRILMPNDWLGHPLRKDYVEEDPRLVWNKR